MRRIRLDALAQRLFVSRLRRWRRGISAIAAAVRCWRRRWPGDTAPGLLQFGEHGALTGVSTDDRRRLRTGDVEGSAPMSTGAIASIGWPGATGTAKRTRASSSRIGRVLPPSTAVGAHLQRANTRSISRCALVSRIGGVGRPRRAAAPGAVCLAGSEASITTTSGRCRACAAGRPRGLAGWRGRAAPGWRRPSRLALVRHRRGGRDRCSHARMLAASRCGAMPQHVGMSAPRQPSVGMSCRAVRQVGPARAQALRWWRVAVAGQLRSDGQPPPAVTSRLSPKRPEKSSATAQVGVMPVFVVGPARAFTGLVDGAEDVAARPPPGTKP